MFYLGIDIGKFSSVATLIDEKGTIIDKSLKFSNSTEGANSLLDLINSYVFKTSDLAIAMESTGHYWLSIFSFLFQKNFSISIVNPIQIKSFRKSFTIRKVKNDFVDSILIANYLRIFGYNSFSLPNENLIKLKQLCRHRQRHRPGRERIPLFFGSLAEEPFGRTPRLTTRPDDVTQKNIPDIV